MEPRENFTVGQIPLSTFLPFPLACNTVVLVVQWLSWFDSRPGRYQVN